MERTIFRDITDYSSAWRAIKLEYINELGQLISLPELYSEEKSLWQMIVVDNIKPADLYGEPGHFTKMAIRNQIDPGFDDRYRAICKEYEPIRNTPQGLIDRFYNFIVEMEIDGIAHIRTPHSPIEEYIKRVGDLRIAYMMKSLDDNEFIPLIEWVQVTKQLI